jgi:hypothetical protein
MKFEISHFVQDDNQLVIYSKAMKHSHFDRREKSHKVNRTLMFLDIGMYS